jgi:hypothetical protein
MRFVRERVQDPDLQPLNKQQRNSPLMTLTPTPVDSAPTADTQTFSAETPASIIDPTSPITDAELAELTDEELERASYELGIQIAGDKQVADELVAGIEQIEATHTAAIEAAQTELDTLGTQMVAGIDQHNLNETRKSLQS